MKTTSSFATLLIAGLCCAPEIGRAQLALKTDTAGNPLTAFNLGGANVTGTIPPARLPALLLPPLVLSTSQTTGDLPLAAGTNVVLLTAPLTGTLNLLLPAASTYAAGCVLMVVDPGGYSGASTPVTVTPSAGNDLNADQLAFVILAGRGAVSLQPDGGNGWSMGQSYQRIPGYAGLTLAGPANTEEDTLLSVHNGDDTEAFFVHGDGTAGALSLQINGTLTSDAGGVNSDGDGGFSAESINVASSVSAPTLVLYSIPSGRNSPVPPGQVSIYYHTDGLIHVRTPDGVNHVLSWTNP